MHNFSLYKKDGRFHPATGKTVFISSNWTFDQTKPTALSAAWYFKCIFFTKLCTSCISLWKKRETSALPEAKFPAGFVTA